MSSLSWTTKLNNTNDVTDENLMNAINELQERVQQNWNRSLNNRPTEGGRKRRKKKSRRKKRRKSRKKRKRTRRRR